MKIVDDGPDFESTTVHVIDLDDHNPKTFDRTADADFDDYGKVASLRLAADGTVAWIVCENGFPPELAAGPGTACYRAGEPAMVRSAAHPDARASRVARRCR